MHSINFPTKYKEIVVALGAESAGAFAIYKNGTIIVSDDFGNLLNEQNFANYTNALTKELGGLKPHIILSDLHPDFVTTHLAKELAKKYKVPHVQVQHHVAHSFSSIGDKLLEAEIWNLEANLIGIACDGTGYSEDGTVWGGEIFSLQLSASGFQHKRVGHLEHQTLLGGEKAIEEPARMLIAILAKIPNFNTPDGGPFSNVKNKKDFAYALVKQYYSRNEFELLWNQLEQKFNCIETSSTARILDAVSLLLGFAKNKRAYKHEPVDLLEKNSTLPFTDLKPKIDQALGHQSSVILNTTHLFEYLIKNIHKDKKRLAATAQQYIADGLLEIVTRNQQPVISNKKNCHENQLLVISYQLQNVYFSGGMANNKIISSFLESKGVYISKKIPRGDAGIPFGQISYFLLTNSRN